MKAAPLEESHRRVRATTLESLTRRNHKKSNMEPKGKHHQEVEGFRQANCEKGTKLPSMGLELAGIWELEALGINPAQRLKYADAICA